MTRDYVFDALKSDLIKVVLARVALSVKWFEVVSLVCFVHLISCDDVLTVMSCSMVH